MSPFTPAGARLAAFASAVLWLATLAAQDGLPARARTIAGFAAAGIDRGLRDGDPPRSVRSAGDLVLRTSPAAQQAMVASVNGNGTPDLPYAAFDILALDPAADPEAVARRLDAQPDVEYAQARYRVRPLFVPNDPLYPQQWNYRTLDMERAWDINPGAASSVTVAVLDSGLAYRDMTLRFTTSSQRIDGVLFPSLGTIEVPFAAAPDLGGPDRFVSPYDFIWDDATPVDMDGHGTHVAGTIGQLTNNSAGAAGMAFNVKLMPVKVIDSFWDAYFESPFVGTDDVVARGIRYAVDNGAKVLNMSIGRTGPAAPVVQAAVAYAVSHGAFVSVAAGNEFREGNQVDRLAEFAPQIAGMVAVSAVGRDRLRAGYSSTGSYVELAAPGGDATRGGSSAAILQQSYDFNFVETYDGESGSIRAPRFDFFAFQFFQGTSMAAPHVSGLAAMLIQQGITTPAAIEAAMKQYATDLGPAGRDNEYGHGLINPRASLRGMGLVR
jgi:serine protease